MGATSRIISFDALASMTLDHYYDKGVMHDAVFNSNPTFAKLFKKGLNTQATGGGRIQTTLMYEGNGNVSSMGEWDPMDTAPQDGVTIAHYPWAIYGGTIPVSNLQIFQNSGKAQIMKLVRQKAEQTAMTFSEEMNKDLWEIETVVANDDGTTGNGGKKIISIPLYIQEVPSTTSADVGGIDQSANAWWRNLTANSGTESSGTWAMFKGELMRMYHNLSKGAGGPPDLVISDLATYEMYVKAMDSKIQYVYTDKPSIGFQGVQLYGAEWFWDYHVPDPDAGYNFDNSSYSLDSMGAVYMINTKFMELVVGQNKDFKPSKFVEPYDRDGRIAKCVFYGQLACSNRKKQGVLCDITTTLTA